MRHACGFFTNHDGEGWTIQRFLDASQTDALLILRNGRIAFEWYAPGRGVADQHIVFSVTKSLVGSLAGVLVEKSLLSTQASVVHYVPEMSRSGYAGASVRDLLDMTVSLDFEEAYLIPDSPYARYREATGWHEGQPGRAPSDMHHFLAEIAANGQAHGRKFSYLSPNSDLLGWVCERAGGAWLRNPSLRADLETAGRRGSCFNHGRSYRRRARSWWVSICTLRDMARFGECMRTCGSVDGRRVIPPEWVRDILKAGDCTAFKQAA